MWRILGLVFYGDKNHFVVAGARKFNYELVVDFCQSVGIALFDTASSVRRLQNNASDKFLEIVEPTDLAVLLRQIPECHTIVTTGEKATDAIVERYGCQKPKVGSFSALTIGGRGYRFLECHHRQGLIRLLLKIKRLFMVRCFEPSKCLNLNKSFPITDF